MKFRLVESIEEYITSPKMIEEIKGKLVGKIRKEEIENFNLFPVCHEVCNAIKEIIPEVEIITDFYMYVMDDEEGMNPIGNKGHYVIKYQNKIYDFTNQQYRNFDIYPEDLINSVPVIFNNIDGKYVCNYNGGQMIIETE